MSASRVVLHVGLPKTGTSFLQGALRENVDLLERHGVRLPAAQGEQLFLAVLHVTDRSEAWGRASGSGREPWARTCKAALARAGTTVISSETLCLASDDQIARILSDLDGAEVDVVVTVRDPGRQIPAEWQEGVKHGRRHSFPRFLDTILGDAGETEGRVYARTRFWAAQDPLVVLDRWAAHVGTDRVHVVVNPAPGAPRDLLWRRFARVLGVEDVEVALPAAQVNASLGRVQVEVLRRLNRRFVRKGHERAYGDIVKRLYSGTILRSQGGEKVTFPPARLEEVRRIATGWTDEITARGYDVSGDLADLVPAAAGEHSSAATPKEMLEASLDATADLLLEVQRLRGEVARLRAEAAGRKRPASPKPLVRVGSADQA